MKPSQTIFNREHQAVTISLQEYRRLRLCERHSNAIKELLEDGDGE